METLDEKAIFRQMDRCIILANGFYEWKNKEKYYIRKEDPYIYLAGLFNKENEFVIITGESKEDMSKIHHRSPVIFDNKEMLNYLHNNLNPYINNNALIIDKKII